MLEDKLDSLGKYKIIDEIGRGRFSVVYRAEHPQLKKIVALKCMQPVFFNSPEIINQFIRQAQSVAAIQNDHITQLLDLTEDQGKLFMVMEFFAGGNLDQWRKKHQLDFRQIAQILFDISSGLDYAHSLGLVHGDVKPGNILIAEDGSARLADLGMLNVIAASGAGNAEITRATPAYISPEQAEGGPATPSSDQYALAVVAYEMFTGRLPFIGETTLAIYLKHVREAPPAASQINPLVTPQMEQLINRALEKDPLKRFPDCGSFIRAIKAEVDAAENRRFHELIVKADSALAMNDLKTARGLTDAAAQAMPDDASLGALLEKLHLREKAQLSYEAAMNALISAHARAQALRAEKKAPSDPQLILARLEPLPPPVWEKFARRWRPALILVAAIGLLGLLSGFAGILYTGLVPAGIYQKSTLVAQIRTSTPIPPTATPTATFTPTATVTPTPTQTLTPVPTLILGSILTREKDGMEMVYVPAGAFTMGSQNGQDDEAPVGKVLLAAYWFDQVEVTNGMFSLCVQADICQPPASSTSSTRSSYYGNPTFDQYPVINVNWNQARDYCSWAGARLPTEAEWEKAARGSDERTYPWGEEIDKTYANYIGGIGDTAKVGSYTKGASPYGALDLAGNVWEWVSSKYQPYPYTTEDGREDLTSGGQRVLRGGSWYYHYDLARTTYRYAEDPGYATLDIGFRCARDISP